MQSSLFESANFLRFLLEESLWRQRARRSMNPLCTHPRHFYAIQNNAKLFKRWLVGCKSSHESHNSSTTLQMIRDSTTCRNSPIVVAGNKADLERKRTVTKNGKHIGGCCRDKRCHLHSLLFSRSSNGIRTFRFRAAWNLGGFGPWRRRSPCESCRRVERSLCPRYVLYW